jgi:GntR family transcriptional regulator, galactonate operon transcriptional repressor
MYEPMDARLATTRATDDEITEIERCYQSLQDAVDSPGRYIAADLQFLMAICAAALTELLQKIMGTLDAALRSSRTITSQLAGANQKAMPLHGTITRAISKRDAQAAESAMRELVTLTTTDIQRVLDKCEDEDKQ